MKMMSITQSGLCLNIARLPNNKTFHRTANDVVARVAATKQIIVKTTTQPQHNPKTTPKQPNTNQRKLGLT